MDVAGGAGGGIEQCHHLANPRQPGRIGRAHQKTVRAIVGRHDDPLRRFAAGLGAGLVREQPVDALRHVQRRRMEQRDQHRIGATRNVKRRDDPRDALQVAGVIGDHQRVAVRHHGDRIVRSDQRAQGREQLRRRFVGQDEYPGLDLVAAAARQV